MTPRERVDHAARLFHLKQADAAIPLNLRFRLEEMKRDRLQRFVIDMKRPGEER